MTGIRPPLRARITDGWVVVALLAVVAVLNQMDRQAVAVLKPTLKEHFALTEGDYGLLVNAFTIAYALSYPMCGWLVDRLGNRVAMPLFIGVWSLANLACAFVESFAALLVFRALLGLAEPGSAPGALRALTAWFPSERRGFVSSVFNFGAIFAPFLIAFLATSLSWQAAFVVPSVAGLALALVWWLVYWEPARAVETHGGTGRESEGSFSWRALWGTRTFWGVLSIRFVSDPVWYFILFWMPGYLQEQRGMSLADAGRVAWIPHLVANLGGIGAAVLADRLVRGGADPIRARQRVLTLAAAVAPLAMLVPTLTSTVLVVGLLSFMGAICLIWIFGLGVLVSEAFPLGNVASVWGLAGAAGAAGTVIFNFILGRLGPEQDRAAVFYCLGALHLVATMILWATVRRESPGPLRPQSVS
jgi:ACS family hexuronate transporter-like MFS transporter